MTAQFGPSTVDVADALGELVMFMYQGVVDAATPESWKRGRLVRQAAWRRLLSTDAGGRRATLQQWIGEALAWVHEIADPRVIFAARPSPPASWPAVDSASIVRCSCDSDGTVRAVQAKTSSDLPRSECLAALRRFAALQEGEYDDAWNEMLRLLAFQAQREGVEFQIERYFANGPTHFAISVVGGRSSTDPVSDYDIHVKAEQLGRWLALNVRPDLPTLLDRVAVWIEARIQ